MNQRKKVTQPKMVDIPISPISDDRVEIYVGCCKNSTESFHAGTLFRYGG